MIGTSKRPARSTMTMSNYDKQPYIQVSENNDDCITGWENICSHLNSQLAQRKPGRTVVVVDCYHGVQHSEVETSLRSGVKHELFIKSTDAFKSEAEIQEMVYPFVTDDRIFGFVTNLEIDAYFDKKKLSAIRQQIDSIPEGIVVVYGEGAACVAQHCDVLIYVDMARWEIQLRMRRNEVANLGVANHKAEFTALYKQAFFVDWRVLDRHKVKLMDRWNFVLDTNKSGQPKLTTGDAILRGLEMASQQPFRVVPFFDPGPWGGQWLKEVADLDRSVVNFAWAFDCVPEENSLLFKFGDVVFELPSINLVLKKPELLLGEKVYKRFGAEFPIRFDFLDTMDGGNLSLQVHPTDEYIKEQFGMSFTQDESYYMMDAKEGAVVYLGLKEDVNPDEMITELENAQQEGGYFDADKHVEKW
ncbi:MAG TPA: mannose-6-phosphate isomerase, partial [Chryseosolibacter sp.]|nr:mannose-6-phosphate isomerase [Chryseosolibacter sp.]